MLQHEHVWPHLIETGSLLPRSGSRANQACGQIQVPITTSKPQRPSDGMLVSTQVFQMPHGMYVMLYMKCKDPDWVSLSA